MLDGHDWEYLLTEPGWLRFDRTLGVGAYRLGLMMVTGALVWGAIYLARNRDQAPEPAAGRYGRQGIRREVVDDTHGYADHTQKSATWHPVGTRA